MREIIVCKFCDKKLINPFNFYSLMKYDSEREDFDEKKFDFCSKECGKSFDIQDTQDIESFELYEVDRCPGYYDCLEFDNLRGMCEKIKPVKEDVFGGFLSGKWCEPSGVTLVRTTNKVNKILRIFSRKSDEQFKTNIDLTRAIIVIAVITGLISLLNLFLFLKQLGIM